ncbi:MAG: hypothetical protein LBC59_03540 [Chitinispirillales bacterium]|jgi:hypothetical protein|nr:hypothetical protein [Chitinispirillales bacterium]
MITAKMETKPFVDDIDGVSEDDSEDDYEYVYPQELLEEWARDAEIMKEQAARGEIKPQTVEEFAAEMGVVLD